MIIADDKQMKKQTVCPGVRFDPITESVLNFGKSFAYTTKARKQMTEDGALSAF